MTTDCIHCGQNPGEVCRGCYERTRREAQDRGDARLDQQYETAHILRVQNGDLAKRAVLAEQERDRLRESLQITIAECDRLRREALKYTDTDTVPATPWRRPWATSNPTPPPSA